MTTTQPGDVWHVGNHRLAIGDASDRDLVTKLFQGSTPDLVVTSPPYKHQRVYDHQIGDWDAMMQGVCTAIPTHATTQIIVNVGMVHKIEVDVFWWDWCQWMRNTWRWFAWYVWDKCQGTPGNARGRLAPCHEWLLHFNTTPREANKTIAKLPQSIKFRPTSGGGRTRHGKRTYSSTPLSNLHPFKIPDSVIRVNPRDNKTGTNHPAIFPVPLPATLIEAFTDAGQLVFDPFAGAATTIVAADRTGRIGYGVELSPAYADQALHRLRRETGIIPRDQDGRSFDPQFFA